MYSTVAYFCHHLLKNHIDLADPRVISTDLYVDLLDHVMSVSRISRTVRWHVYVLRLIFELISQQKYLTNRSTIPTSQQCSKSENSCCIKIFLRTTLSTCIANLNYTHTPSPPHQKWKGPSQCDGAINSTFYT